MLRVWWSDFASLARSRSVCDCACVSGRRPGSGWPPCSFPLTIPRLSPHSLSLSRHTHKHTDHALFSLSLITHTLVANTALCPSLSSHTLSHHVLSLSSHPPLSSLTPHSSLIDESSVISHHSPLITHHSSLTSAAHGSTCLHPVPPTASALPSGAVTLSRSAPLSPQPSHQEHGCQCHLKSSISIMSMSRSEPEPEQGLAAIINTSSHALPPPRRSGSRC
eukprot:3123232-Rhodomonas_salina.1